MSWLAAHPEIVVALTPLVVAILGALVNALDVYTSSRWPRLAGVLRALLPHLQGVARAAMAKPYSGAAPGPQDPPAPRPPLPPLPPALPREEPPS